MPEERAAGLFLKRGEARIDLVAALPVRTVRTRRLLELIAALLSQCSRLTAGLLR